MKARWIAVALVAAACSKSEENKPAPAPEPPGKADPFLTFDATAPKVGDVAPAFELTSLAGDKVSLASAVARGPVVLVFASYTCPPSRMKLPGFEAMAQRWQGRASVYVVYQQEAHPHAKNSQRLNGFADQVYALDADADGQVTLEEYGDLAPRYMFDAFDLDHDGAVRSYEFLAARRLDQFTDVDAPTTYDQRVAIARRLRDDVPGAVPVLVDGLDDAVATAYGGLPNMAYVIGADGKVAFKIPWAAVDDVERAVAVALGAPPPVQHARVADLSPIQPQLDAAKQAGKPVLLELSAIGCKACVKLKATLADPRLADELARYERVERGIERDAEWRMFESLALAATPALVAIRPDGVAVATLQGARSVEDVEAFLARHAN